MVPLGRLFPKILGFTHGWTRTNHANFMKIGSKLRPASCDLIHYIHVYIQNFCVKDPFLKNGQMLPKTFFVISSASLKKWSYPPKFFSPFFRKIYLFSKKLLDEKIFKTSFPIKNVIFIFAAKCPLLFRRVLAPKNGFLPFSRKIPLF